MSVAHLLHIGLCVCAHVFYLFIFVFVTKVWCISILENLESFGNVDIKIFTFHLATSEKTSDNVSFWCFYARCVHMEFIL